MTDEELIKIGRAVLRLPDLACALWYDGVGDTYEGGQYMIGLSCLDDGTYKIDVRCGVMSIREYGLYDTPQEAIEAAIADQKRHAKHPREKASGDWHWSASIFAKRDPQTTSDQSTCGEGTHD